MIRGARGLRATASAGAALAVVVSLGCSPTPPPAAPLDADAREACDRFAPIAGDVRSGELEGPPLFRALQDVWNAARTSDNSDVSDASQRALTAAINDDQSALGTAVTELQEACGLPFT